MSELCVKREKSEVFGGRDAGQSTADAHRFKGMAVRGRRRIVVAAHPYEDVASHCGGDTPPGHSAGEQVSSAENATFAVEIEKIQKRWRSHDRMLAVAGSRRSVDPSICGLTGRRQHCGGARAPGANPIRSSSAIQ